MSDPSWPGAGNEGPSPHGPSWSPDATPSAPSSGAPPSYGAPPAYGAPPPAGGPYGGPPAQPPGYGYPPSPYGAGGYAVPREHPQGSTILVFGILGIVLCGILAPVAWNMGGKALREIDAQPPGAYTNRGSVQAGRILGIIGTVLLGLGIAYFLFVIVLIGAMGTTS